MGQLAVLIFQHEMGKKEQVRMERAQMSLDNSASLPDPTEDIRRGTPVLHFQDKFLVRRSIRWMHSPNQTV
jgi:hypothetical protein